MWKLNVNFKMSDKCLKMLPINLSFFHVQASYTRVLRHIENDIPVTVEVLLLDD